MPVNTNSPASPTVEKIKKYQKKAHDQSVIKLHPHYFDLIDIHATETDSISTLSSDIKLPKRYDSNTRNDLFKVVPVKPNSLNDATYISGAVSTCTIHKSGDQFSKDHYKTVLYSDCYVYVEISNDSNKNAPIVERYIAYKKKFYLDNDQDFTTIEDYIPIPYKAMENQTTITVKMFISQFYFSKQSIKHVFSTPSYQDIISILEVVTPEETSDSQQDMKNIKVKVSSESKSKNAEYNSLLIQKYHNNNYHQNFGICLYNPLIELENIIFYYRHIYDINLIKQSPYIQELSQNNSYQDYDLSKIQDRLMYSEEYMKKLTPNSMYKFTLEQMYHNYKTVRKFLGGVTANIYHESNPKFDYKKKKSDPQYKVPKYFEYMNITIKGIVYNLALSSYSSDQEELYRLHYPLMYHLSFIASLDSLHTITQNAAAYQYITLLLSLLFPCNKFCTHALNNGCKQTPKADYKKCVPGKNLYKRTHIEKLYTDSSYKKFYTAFHGPVNDTYIKEEELIVDKYNLDIDSIISHINDSDTQFQLLAGLIFNPDSALANTDVKAKDLVTSPLFVLSYAENFVTGIGKSGFAVDNELAKLSLTPIDTNKKVKKSFTYLYNYVSILSTYHRLFKKLTITPEVRNKFSMLNTNISESLSFLVDVPLNTSLTSCLDLCPSDSTFKNQSLYDSLQETLKYFLSSLYIIHKYISDKPSSSAFTSLKNIEDRYKDPSKLHKLFAQDDFVITPLNTVWKITHSILKKPSDGYTNTNKILDIASKISNFQVRGITGLITSEKAQKIIHSTENFTDYVQDSIKDLPLKQIKHYLGFIGVAYTIHDICDKTIDIYDKTNDMKKHFKQGEYLDTFCDFITATHDLLDIITQDKDGKHLQLVTSSTKKLLSNLSDKLFTTTVATVSGQALTNVSDHETNKILHAMAQTTEKLKLNRAGKSIENKTKLLVVPNIIKTGKALKFLQKHSGTLLASYSIGSDIKIYVQYNTTLRTKIFLGIDILLKAITLLPVLARVITESAKEITKWNGKTIQVVLTELIERKATKRAEQLALKAIRPVLLNMSEKLLLRVIASLCEVFGGPIGFILVCVLGYLFDKFKEYCKSYKQTSYGIWLSETMWGKTNIHKIDRKNKDDNTLYESVYFKIVQHMREIPKYHDKSIKHSSDSVNTQSFSNTKGKTTILLDVTKDFNNIFTTHIKDKNKDYINSLQIAENDIKNILHPKKEYTQDTQDIKNTQDIKSKKDNIVLQSSTIDNASVREKLQLPKEQQIKSQAFLHSYSTLDSVENAIHNSPFTVLDLITIDRIEQTKGLSPKDFLTPVTKKSVEGIHMSAGTVNDYTVTITLPSSITTFNLNDITIKLVFQSPAPENKYIIEDISIRLIKSKGHIYTLMFKDSDIDKTNPKFKLKFLLVIHNRLSLIGKINTIGTDQSQPNHSTQTPKNDPPNYALPSYVYSLFDFNLSSKSNTIKLTPLSIITASPQLSALIVHHFNALMYDKLPPSSSSRP